MRFGDGERNIDFLRCVNGVDGNSKGSGCSLDEIRALCVERNAVVVVGGDVKIKGVASRINDPPIRQSLGDEQHAQVLVPFGYGILARRENDVVGASAGGYGECVLAGAFGHG